jgi:hypothetical protein
MALDHIWPSKLKRRRLRDLVCYGTAILSLQSTSCGSLDWFHTCPSLFPFAKKFAQSKHMSFNISCVKNALRVVSVVLRF